MQLTLASLETDLCKQLPADPVKRLLKAYEEIKENFYLGKHEPAELHAGKLCEALVRILEHEAGMPLTPFGTPIKDMGVHLRSFENKSTAKPSIRFHLPRVANALYHLRNTRGVGHLGGDVDPNPADATLVTAGADWIVAELVRLHYGCTLDEAQSLVNRLVQRRLPLVYEIDGVHRVLAPGLSFAKKTLLLLAAQPCSVAEPDLFEWVEHSNSSVYRRDILKRLHASRLIEYRNGKCTIMPPGMKEVEENYQSWVASP